MSMYPPVRSLSDDERTRVVKDIFTTAHARYDFLNHLLSLGRDMGWRTSTARKMRFLTTRRLLDVATGTADLAIRAAELHPEIEVTGIDFAEPMLGVGRRKIAARDLQGRVNLVRGDATALPFEDSSFDVTAAAFALRNIPDRLRALREMARVTTPGGRVMVLEMTFAPVPAFRGFYKVYLNHVLPRLAGFFARDSAPYSYLADSIMHFPGPDAFSDTMRQAGLTGVVYHRLTFGSAYLHIGRIASPKRR